MADIDLIPQTYRAKMWARLWWHRFTITALILTSLGAIVCSGLYYWVHTLQAELRELEREMAITTRQRDELTRLSQQKSNLSRQWHLLNGLRGGTSALDTLLAIDHALRNTDIWFQRWDFTRAGAEVEAPPKTVNTGYFIVIPQGENTTAAKTWQIRTHMTIHGEAKDHVALSEFIQRLFKHKKISDVKVMHTGQRHYGKVQVVQFELVVLVNSIAQVS